jgi:hypothetical protein
MEIFGVLLVMWCLKVLAEDGFAQLKGETNPRIERRRQRQRSRANNRIWTQFVGWLGDVAEDGRQEQGRRRQAKRERQQRQREQAAAEPEVIEPPVRPDRTPVPDAPAETIDIPLDDPQIPDPEKTDSPPDPEPEPEPIPAEPADDERPLATVIPMFPTKEDLNMSTPSGEAPGLVHAIGFAEAMKTTYKNFSATGDTFEASLAQGDVSGEAAAAAARAREFERMAAEAWGQCATALKKQLSGKEFYNANPGAGTREFLVNE